MSEPRPAVPTKPSSEPSYREQVEHIYLLLDENFDTLDRRCSTSEQKKQLCDTHSVTRYTRWKVGQQSRPDESRAKRSASRDLKKANVQLTAMLTNQGDIGAFLSLATEAVRLAASLSRPSADA